MHGKVYSHFKMSHNSDLASKGPEDEPQKVKAAVFSNIALCHLKLKNYYEVKKAVSWKYYTAFVGLLMEMVILSCFCWSIWLF